MKQHPKTLLQLFIPICLETLFYMLSGMVDTLMLSSVGDNAVGAVGTANTYIGVFIIMFSVISTGVMAVMTQNIGAKRQGVAYQARQIGLLFNLCLGIVLGILLSTCSGIILDFIGISKDLYNPAKTYFQIVGGFCILNALIPIFSGYLRAFGHTNCSFWATFFANLMNFSLNAIFLFVLHLGVAGVAYATVISKVINLLIVFCLSQKLIKAKSDKHRISNKAVMGQIIKVGLPSAAETLLYNIAMTLVIRFLNKMDPNGFNVTARSYTAQITNFSFCAGAALAQANAILTGWRIGAKQFDECDKGTIKAARIGIFVALCIEGIFALSGRQIMRFFSDDPAMVDIVVKLLFIDIALEIGRVSNLIFGNALKTSGDVFFPMIIACIFMYLCAVGGTYVLGLRMEWCIVGAYIGLSADEIVRAIGMFLRWRSGVWRKKSLL